MQASISLSGGEDKFIPIAQITDPNLENNSATSSEDLTPLADLAVTITRIPNENTKTGGPGPLVPGEAVTYSIVASNNGPSDAPNAFVSADWGEGLAEVGWSCQTGGEALCPEETDKAFGVLEDPVGLPSGSSLTFTVTGEVDSSATGDLTIGTEVTLESRLEDHKTIEIEIGVVDPNPENNRATANELLYPAADLGVTVDNEVDEVVAGEEVSYSIVASNDGPSDAPNAMVFVNWPEHLEETSWDCVATGEALCDQEKTGWGFNDPVNLPAGSSITYTITGDVGQTASGDFEVSASIVTDGGDFTKVAKTPVPEVVDPNDDNNSDADSDPVVYSADLALDLNSEFDSVVPGEEVEITAIVENLGPSDATGGSVGLLLDGLVFVSSEDGCVSSDNKVAVDVHCDFESLEADDWTEHTMVVRIPAEAEDGTEFTVAGWTDAEQDDPDSNNNQDELVILVDTAFPTVLSIDAGEEALSECESVTSAADSIVVVFSEAVSDPATEGAQAKRGVPDFLLVTSGEDGLFETVACGYDSAGDDRWVTIDDILWFEDGSVAALQFDEPLDNDLYRFLVCASGSLQDAAGKGLDGDGDGTPGDDLVIGFRVDQGNLFDNGQMDCGLDGWSIGFPQNSDWMDDSDRDAEADSGAALVVGGLRNELGQCVAHSNERTRLEASVFLKSFSRKPTVALICDHFSDTYCEVSLGAIDRDLNYLDDLDTWVDLSFPVNPPDGTGSSYCKVKIVGSGFEFDVDSLALRVVEPMVFSNGFESGDLSSWTGAIQ